MLTGKYVSAKFIIEKLFRDYPFPPTEINEDTVLDHIYNAMMLVGAPSAFEDKISVLTIADYRSELPCGLIDLTPGNVRIHGTKQPLIAATDIYYQSSDDGTHNNELDTNLPYYSTYSSMRTILSTDNTNSYYTYRINNNYIFTNFENGEVDIVYKAFPMDNEDYPMIPDNVRYIEGITCYVAERIGFKLWGMGLLTREFYQELKSNRNWYMASANNAARIPSLDEMEALKNQWLSPIPVMNQHAYSFKYLNRRQRIRTYTS